ncbi:phosphatidylglycerophosphatase B [Lachnospiraceae bacterium KM106-2]|nr:phosphatidylglycerophosphatase B [Lachnospiraceae bacterium KM106-2]
MATWLNSIFAEYDHAILSGLHHLAIMTGGALTPLFSIISAFAEKGVGMLLLGLCLMGFKKTRKLGVCVFGAICCGALITNVILKDWIARPRPYIDINSIYHSWWMYAGKTMETGCSFPSGHVTGTMAAMTAIFLTCNKKKSWMAFLVVILMGISRNYLMVHYPSDVLGGMIAGAVAATVSFYITKLIYRYLEDNLEKKLCRFAIRFDVGEVWKRRAKSRK